MSCHWTTPQGGRASIDRLQARERRKAAAARRRPLEPARAQFTEPTHGSSMLCNHARLLDGVKVRAKTYLRAALSAAALLGTLLVAATPALAAAVKRLCRNAALAPNAEDVAALERATVCVVNIERAHHRLRPLRDNSALARVARGQSVDMVRGDYFADHSLAGRTPLERILPALLPVHVATTGQNIGWGSGQDATPARIVRAWMESPPHRRIILTRTYTEIGAGIAPSLPAMLEAGTRGATYTLDVTSVATGAHAPATRARHASAPSTRRPASARHERIAAITTTTQTAQEVEAG
jgi:uncharacterized protein YkwD